MYKQSLPRLFSLDAFRGITIFLMILVNSPGNSSAYSWLEHSSWNGCTLADLVFPFFIVIVGISSVLALTGLKHKGISTQQLLIKIGKRSAYLFIMGLLLNAFPHHFDPAYLRIFGVLQRIGICYFFSAILFLTTTLRVQIILIFILLIGYWLLVSYFSGNYIVGYLDQWLLSANHLYTPTFDPEGLLSTLPAIASALLGNLLGIYLTSSNTKQQQFQWMLLVGTLLAILGWCWSFVFPFNKPLWSSSYVLWTGGLAFLAFGLCFALIEIKRYKTWSSPFVLFGKHALLIYMLHVLFLKIQAIILVPSTQGSLVNLRIYITDFLFGNLTSLNASLCYAITYTLFWLCVLKCINRQNKKPKL